MQKRVTIVADTNDADYVTAISDIDDDFESYFGELIEAIKNFEPYKGKSKYSTLEHTHRHNWPTGELVREDLGEKYPEQIYSQFPEDMIEAFSEYLPHGEYGIHTIESITISQVQHEKKLL